MNLLLPNEMMWEMSKKLEEGHLASGSGSVRQLISSDKLYKELEQQEKEFAAGKGILLKSLKDLG